MAKKGTGTKSPAASMPAQSLPTAQVLHSPAGAMSPSSILAGAVVSDAGAADVGFPIVGIGASAGGLEGLERFFAALPPACGMAFVIIQHLDPTHPSAMATLLQRHTSMHVTEASEQDVEVDHVYVMPPGAKAIKAETGMVMVQAPETARYDGMPRAAITGGVADYVMAPQEVPASLIEYVSRSHGAAAAMRRENAEGQATDMARIFSLLPCAPGAIFPDTSRPRSNGGWSGA